MNSEIRHKPESRALDDKLPRASTHAPRAYGYSEIHHKPESRAFGDKLPRASTHAPRAYGYTLL